MSAGELNLALRGRPQRAEAIGLVSARLSECKRRVGKKDLGVAESAFHAVLRLYISSHSQAVTRRAC